jgi:hypothetical protein
MAKNLERVKKDGYSIEARERSQLLSVVLTGTFDMTATQDLQKFLEDVRAEVMATKPRELEIDVSSVYYLGSSCIKAFVSLTAALKAASKRPLLRILTSSRLDWQERTFAVLARLAPDMVNVERVA